MTKWLIVLLASTLSLATFSEEKPQSDKSTNATDSNDKLDLKQLEDKYWSAKDSDFNVVQNRTYTKEKKFFASFNYGVLINDAYSTGKMLNFASGYYFNERWGVELASENGALSDNGSTTALSTYNGLKPNYNKFINYTSVNMLWVPLYAKMSFIDQKILYFDIQFTLGLGSMTYQNQLDPLETSSMTKKSIGYNFDFTSQLFFHKHWAIRLDVKNKWSTQDLMRYRLSGSNSGSRDMGQMNQQDSTFLLGITYFH